MEIMHLGLLINLDLL